MNTVQVYERKKKRVHLVNADKYERVSTSKSLCGIDGSKYWIPDAIYWHGENYPMCKKCLSEVEKQNQLKL
jgi:hypothetical protein